VNNPLATIVIITEGVVLNAFLDVAGREELKIFAELHVVSACRYRLYVTAGIDCT
jgi:hypothetical protein